MCKKRAYYHLTPELDVIVGEKGYLAKITNTKFVETHGFFPLLHSSIKERRYKIINQANGRSHVHPVKVPTAKKRPLHYATHIDSLILGYYSQVLQLLYESVLLQDQQLSDAITAYR